MRLLRKKHPMPIPAPFSAEDVKIESSICTGERTIGFYDRSSKKLLYAELVRTEQDVADFYAKYGISRSTEK